MKEIVLVGTVTGRARAMPALDPSGVPKPASHDRDVTLTFNFPVVGSRPAEFDVRFDLVPRGFMEIGQRVLLTLREGE